jgi:uncharacterized membrane protein
MLAHAPIVCWGFIPFCDLAALNFAPDFFHQVAALMGAVGTGAGALAATAGALDFERAHKARPRVALWHACLMGVAFTLELISLMGRVEARDMHVVAAPPFAIAASGVGLIVMIAGAACGGELVYGAGVGVRPKAGE